MRDICKDLKELFQNKFYCILLLIIGICTYGFVITHFSIGIDDTAIPMYFEEGLAPYVGRWTLYMINKVVPITKLSPFLVEAVSMLLMLISASLWCVLWKRIISNVIEVPWWIYVLVAGIFVTCPLISEVYVFYLHNGICIGYGLTALGLLFFMKSLEKGQNTKALIKYSVFAGLFLFVALGCYESLMIVFAMGAVLAFILLRCFCDIKGTDVHYDTAFVKWIAAGLIAVVTSLIGRTIILKLLNVVNDWSAFDNLNVTQRGLLSGIFIPMEELVMNIKRFIMLYYVNAVCYLPITVLVCAFVVLGIVTIIYSIKKKDWLIFGAFIALPILPVCLTILEGYTTRYRTCQYVPLVCSFAILFVFIMVLKNGRKWLLSVCGVLCGLLVVVQCMDMNQWFYIDYQKYQHAKSVMTGVAVDLQELENYEKPIIFTGGYPVPAEITEKAYVSFHSKKYRLIYLLTDWFDPHLREKYYSITNSGYAFAEMPYMSTLQWGLTAFDGTSNQLIEFLKMHGYSFNGETDLAKYNEAIELRQSLAMPCYPEDGYILECQDYIIVNLSNYFD